jgi:Kef-type K+ transport system membrane component KefB/nucleotide-binding universal stress UspA family protein
MLPTRLASAAPYLCAAAFTVLAGTSAFAAQSGGPSEVIFVIQLVLLMLVGRLLGEAMQRIGQPSVMGQLLAGILLGPSVFGALWPDLQHMLFPTSGPQKAMIDAIAQFGILLLLLLTGMETDLRLVRKVGRAALSISVTGVAVPFACGFALGWFMPEWLLPAPDQRLLTALFLGTALSISSIKIVAAVVREMGFTRRNLGQVIVASAICEDTIGWVIIAITFSLAQSGTIDLAHVAKSVLGTAAFLVASFTIGRRVVFTLIRWANDSFTSEFPVITVILVIMGLMALTTHFIGVHTVLGAFVAGVLIGESPILTRHIDEQLRGLILAFFMPVFFGMAGLSADLTILQNPQLLLMAVGLIAIASIGKFAGAFIGGEIGGLKVRESLALACGMNARGSTEVIVASIGLSMGALTQDLFTMIVAMAIVTTMAMPPMLRWGLSRVRLSKSERERLEREELEERGFVPNLERLLLAVDDSANGKFAARLAGLLAGPRGMPITVLPLSSAKTPKKAESKKLQPDNSEPKEPTSADVVKTTADATRNGNEDDTPLSEVDVTVRASDQPPAEAVAEEVKKGYDLLFAAIETMRAKTGGFHPDLAGLTSSFEGPLAVVAAHGPHLKRPAESRFNILVPVTGTEVSQRAAEVAIALARAADAPLTALYVSTTKPNGRRRRSYRDRQREQAILKDIVERAEKYDLDIRTAIRADTSPVQAIVHEAKRSGHDLIVMGVNRRTGESLDFGDTAAAVFDKAGSSILFVAS